MFKGGPKLHQWFVPCRFGESQPASVLRAALGLAGCSCVGEQRVLAGTGYQLHAGDRRGCGSESGPRCRF